MFSEKLTEVESVAVRRFVMTGECFQGDNSTKIEGIVQCLLHIQQQDPTAKCLVFSTVGVCKVSSVQALSCG